MGSLLCQAESWGPPLGSSLLKCTISTPLLTPKQKEVFSGQSSLMVHVFLGAADSLEFTL